MLKVEHCHLFGVDSICQVLFCVTERDAEEDGEQCGSQDAPLFEAVGDGEAA